MAARYFQTFVSPHLYNVWQEVATTTIQSLIKDHAHNTAPFEFCDYTAGKWGKGMPRFNIYDTPPNYNVTKMLRTPVLNF